MFIGDGLNALVHPGVVEVGGIKGAQGFTDILYDVIGQVLQNGRQVGMAGRGVLLRDGGEQHPYWP